MTLDEVSQFDWLMETDIVEYGGCITVVPGADLHGVISAFGGDPTQATEAELDSEFPDAPTALLRRVGDHVLVVESNGYQGSREEVLRRLPGATVSVYWNVNAVTRFSYALDGRMQAAFEALAWDRLSDVELDAMHGQAAGLPWNDADPESVMLALTARLTGFVLRPEHLAGPMTRVPLVPWQRDMADLVPPPYELSGRLRADQATSHALEHADEHHQRAAARVAAHVAAQAAGLDDPALRAVVEGHAGVTEQVVLDQMARELEFAWLYPLLGPDVQARSRIHGSRAKLAAQFRAVEAARAALVPNALAAAFQAVTEADYAVAGNWAALRAAVMTALGNPQTPTGAD